MLRASSSARTARALNAKPPAAARLAPYPGRSSARRRSSLGSRSASCRQSEPEPGWPCSRTTSWLLTSDDSNPCFHPRGGRPAADQHEWQGGAQQNGADACHTNGGQFTGKSVARRTRRVIHSRGTDARHLSPCASRAAPTLADQRRSADVDATMIAVGIVDDHPVVRHGMSHLLEQWPGVTVVSSGATVGELGATDSLDVVVLDLYLAHAGLCDRDRGAGRDVRGAGAAGHPGAVGLLTGRGGRLDARRSGVVQPIAPPGPAGGGPAVQPRTI